MPYLTVVDLETDSKISRYTWRAWIRDGRLPVARLGRQLRVAEEDYHEFIRRHRIQPKAQQPISPTAKLSGSGFVEAEHRPEREGGIIPWRASPGENR